MALFALAQEREGGLTQRHRAIPARLAENVNTVCRFQQENPEAGAEMGKVTAFRETSRQTENFGPAMVVQAVKPPSMASESPVEIATKNHADPYNLSLRRGTR